VDLSPPLAGSCDPSGMLAEAWRFRPGQFLHVDKVAGLRAVCGARGATQ